MTIEGITDPDLIADSEDPLIARLERLEAEHKIFRTESDRRLVLSETKAEALKAGMIDLDGVRFLDLNGLQPSEDGTITGITDLITHLKASKPWLFSALSSSSIAKVPPSRPSRQKLATEMSNDEYRVARARIIGRGAY